jgi:menaquinone-dependent protoporphyrinogen IX oxidase
VSGTVLVEFATLYGSTKELAEAIGSALRNAGIDIDVKPTRNANPSARFKSRAARLDSRC